MKNILIFICFSLLSLNVFGQNFLIQNGATVNLNGSVSIIMNNGIFSNVSNFIPGNSQVIFQGDQNSSIIGNTTFNQLIINKSGNAQVELMSDIAVNRNLNLQDGILDLNNQKLTLGTDFGQILGENEENRIIANTGTIEKSLVLNTPNAANPGNIGAVITSNQNLGNTTIIRGHEKASNFAGESIQRYYTITPANNSGLNATLRLYYLDAEFSLLNEDDFIFGRSTDGGANWEDIASSTMNTNDNWLEKDNLDAFSTWTIGVPANALSSLFGNFKIYEEKEGILCFWTVPNNSQIDYFEIERSVDASNFKVIKRIEIPILLQEDIEYQFMDKTPLNGLSYYRLKIYLQDNIVYSPSQSIRFNYENSWLLWPHPILGQSTLRLSLSNPTYCKIMLSNAQGKILEIQNLALPEGLNDIPLKLNNYPQGIYFLRIQGENTQTKVFKLLKY